MSNHHNPFPAPHSQAQRDLAAELLPLSLPASSPEVQAAIAAGVDIFVNKYNDEAYVESLLLPAAPEVLAYAVAALND